MRNIIDCRAIGRMADSKLITFMGTVHVGMSASSLLHDAKWHKDSPKIDDLKEVRDAFQDAFAAAVCKDIWKVAAKREARIKSIATIKKIAKNVELSFWGDPAKIAALGFPLKRLQRIANTSPLGATASFTVVRGQHRGQAIGKAKPIPGAAFFEVRFTQSDPTVEEDYVPFDTFTGCSHMEFNGLTPSRQYSFCVRGRSSKSVGPWSFAVTIIAT